MAIYYCDVSVVTKKSSAGIGGVGAAAAACDYIEREGHYPAAEGEALAACSYIERLGRSAETREPVLHSETAYMPSWSMSARDYWQTADREERANAMLARKVVLALPMELELTGQVALVRNYVSEVFKGFPCSWGIHGGHGNNPHVHVMVSERPDDGVERPRELFFRRHNPNNPARGGRRKVTLKQELQAIRAGWSKAVNHALKLAGSRERVSHLSLEAQGIDRIPQIKIGWKNFREYIQTGKNDVVEAAMVIGEINKWRMDHGQKNGLLGVIGGVTGGIWRKITGGQGGDSQPGGHDGGAGTADDSERRVGVALQSACDDLRGELGRVIGGMGNALGRVGETIDQAVEAIATRREREAAEARAATRLEELADLAVGSSWKKYVSVEHERDLALCERFAQIGAIDWVRERGLAAAKKLIVRIKIMLRVDLLVRLPHPAEAPRRREVMPAEPSSREPAPRPAASPRPRTVEATTTLVEAVDYTIDEDVASPSLVDEDTVAKPKPVPVRVKAEADDWRPPQRQWGEYKGEDESEDCVKV